MVMTRIAVLLVLLSVAAPCAGQAQSLAEVAKQEEARRKTVKAPGKVYTNPDLRPDISKSAAPPQTTAAPADSKAPADGKDAADKSKTEEPVKDQAYWSGRIGAARSALERNQIFAEALQSRINALTMDFVNRD